MIITLALLKHLGACADGLAFFERNGLEGIDRSKLAGDLEGWLSWLDDSAGWTVVRDEHGGLISQTDSDGETWQWRCEYDDKGRLVARMEADDKGRLVARMEADDEDDLYPNTWRYSYSDDGRERTEKALGGSVWVYSLDEAGRVVSVTLDGRPSIDYTYDERGNMLSEAHASGRRYTYEYDAKGNRTKQACDDSRWIDWAYVYDDQDRLVSVLEDGREVLAIDWS